MTPPRHNDNADKKLVDLIPPASLNGPEMGKEPTKKRGYRKKAPGRLRPHTVNGKVYYYFCRGRDKEIYLGSADRILMAMRSEAIFEGHT
jgi:hypothetical protein